MNPATIPLNVTPLPPVSRAGFYWALFPVALLGFTVAVGVFTYVLANGDPGFSVEPDAYRKGLAWDATMAQQRANVALGWRIVHDPGPVIGADGAATLMLRVVDAHGKDIPGAVVEVEAFPIARGGEKVILKMETLAENTEVVADGVSAAGRSGVHTVGWAKVRPGRWEFRYTVTAPGGIFTFTEKRELFMDTHRSGGPS